uniref:VWFA domain-containing protein n=1 Tax=Strongyloides venezuelensis TaxID=75913 RepID=A0A0K0FV39_STRVS
MNRRLQCLYFLGVPILALSAFFILFLLLKDSNSNNTNNKYTTILPLNNFTTTSKIQTTTNNFYNSSTTKYTNSNTTSSKTLNTLSTTNIKTSTTKQTEATTTTVSTTTQCTYGEKIKSCKNRVILSLDASSDVLSPQLFQNQINGIKNYVVDRWYDFKEVSLTWYNKIPYIYSTFDSMKSKVEVERFQTYIHQDKGSKMSNLIKQLNKINLHRYRDVATIIFVSKIEESDILNAIDDAPILKKKGSLNFVVLGEVPNFRFLNHLRPNTVFKWDLSIDNGSKLEEFISSIRECKDICPNSTTTVTSTLTTKIITTTSSFPGIVSSTTTPTKGFTTSSTSTKTTTINWVTSTTNAIISTKTPNFQTTTSSQLITTTQTQCRSGIPVKVCDGNIVMAIDATNDTLPKELFSRQIDVISSYIEPSWDDYKKIALSWYNELPTTYFSYGSINNKNEFNNILYSIRQYPGSSLSKLLSSINNLPEQSKKITVFIFISGISDNEITKSIPFAILLKEKGNLNFIILGNVVPISRLDPLKPTAVYSWDFTYANAVEIIKFMNTTMSCTIECSGNSMDNSKPTIKSHFRYTKLRTFDKLKKGSSIRNKCYGGILLKKCLNDILLVLDASNDKLSKSEFTKMTSIIKDHFINPFYDYSHVALSWYNSHSSAYFPFSTIKRKLDFDYDISLINQKSGSKLNRHLKEVVYKYMYNDDKKDRNISTFIFVSSISHLDMLLSITYINTLKKYGSVNIIVMGDYIKKTDLSLLNYSNIFIWDFSWKSTNLLISFLQNVGECRVECHKNVIKKVTQQVLDNISTTTPPLLTTSDFCLNGIGKKNCDSDIYFVVDSTNDTMDDKSFRMEISLLQNNISNTIEDYNNVSLSWYDYNPHLLYPISRIRSKQEFTNSLLMINQSSGSRLSKILRDISSMALVNRNRISVYIFVSKNSTSEFNKSTEYVEIMKRYGNVNFICLGNQVQASDLIQLSPSYTFEWNFDESLVGPLTNFVKGSRTCVIECDQFSTVLPTTKTDETTIVLTSTIAPVSTTESPSCSNGIPVFSCNGDIVIAVDASNDLLLPEDFESEINVIINNISIDWTDFKKVALLWYNQNVAVKSFNIFSSKNIFDDTLRNITQSSGWRLGEVFRLLNSTQTSGVVSTFVFVSEERINEILDSIEYITKFESNGPLNLILLGSNVEEEYFKPLNYTNIFSWDIKNESIPTLVDFFRKSMNCKNVCQSTTFLPTNEPSTLVTGKTVSDSVYYSTIKSDTSRTTNLQSTITENFLNTTPSVIITSQGLVTTSSVDLTTTTSCDKSTIKICDNSIIFAIDSSNDLLTEDDFSKQIKVIKENLVSSINDFNNFALLNYNHNTFMEGFGKIQNLTNFNEIIEKIKQHNGWKLSTLFSNISAIPSLRMNPTSIFVFVSQENIDEIKKSVDFSKIVGEKGNLNIILLGRNLNESFFSPLNSPRIFKWDMTDFSIPLLEEFFKDAQICRDVCADTSTTTSLTKISTLQYETTTSSSAVAVSSTLSDIPNTSTTENSMTDFSTSSLTTSMIPNIKCSTNFYFVIDARGEVSNDLFKQQIDTLINITQKINVAENYISLDINYVNNIFNSLFPIQPKSMSTLLKTTKEWDCALGFISGNEDLYKGSCNNSLLVPFQKSSNSSGPTINKFLQKFQEDFEIFKKTRYLTKENENSVMMFFTLTGSQTEIDDSLEYIQNIKLDYSNFNMLVVKLSPNDTFDYSKLAQYVLDFNSSDLLNFITDNTCN